MLLAITSPEVPVLLEAGLLMGLMYALLPLLPLALLPWRLRAGAAVAAMLLLLPLL
jgi:hypothetical protein